MLPSKGAEIAASIPSPAVDVIEVGPLTLHMYGLMAALGILVGILVAGRLWQFRGGDTEIVWDLAIWAVPAGLIGARLYHVITSPGQVPDEWWGPFAIWDGGLGAWGGMAGGAIAGVLVLRHRGVDVRSFLDVGAPGLLIGFSIGRIGNYFNQELFGRPTEAPWALEIDVANRPSGFEQFETFHPTFLYEMTWNLALAAVLIWLILRVDIKPPGVFALFVAGYSFGRVMLELVRIDTANEILGMRVNFWVGTALVIIGLVWFARSQGRLGRRAGPAGSR